MHAPATTLSRPVFLGRPFFLAFGGESAGGGASDTWDPDDMPPPFGETYTPEDLPLVDEDTQPPPDARPPTGPSAQGVPQGSRHEERSQGWAEIPPVDGDDPLSFYAQQFGCLRQGGTFGADGFCTLSLQSNPCKEHQVFDAVENACVSATEFHRMAEQFAKCRLEGGTVDEKNVTCTASSPKSSSTKIWIGVGVAVAAAATLAILFLPSSKPTSSEATP
jgi:hypothetical protein